MCAGKQQDLPPYHGVVLIASASHACCSRVAAADTMNSRYQNVNETLSTLRFGSRAKHIKNAPRVNQERSPAEYRTVRAPVTDMLDVASTQHNIL